MTSYDWRHQAACLDHSSELFFPIGNSPAALRQTEAAKAVCLGCPVMETCLKWALEAGVSGVWGGLSEDERRALKRRGERARAKVRTQPANLAYEPPKGREYPVKATVVSGLRIGRPV